MYFGGEERNGKAGSTSRAVLELLCAIVILLCLWRFLSDFCLTERWSFDANIFFEYMDKYSFNYRLGRSSNPMTALVT